MSMTIDEVRDHAKIMELKEVNFLDSNGVKGARGNEIVKIQLIFIDDAEGNFTQDEFAKLRDVSFRLRPTTNDS